MQYSHKRVYPTKHVKCTFLDTLVYKDKHKCTGIKHCKNLETNLYVLSHTEVTESIWDTMKRYRGEIEQLESDPSRRNAYRYY